MKSLIIALLAAYSMPLGAQDGSGFRVKPLRAGHKSVEDETEKENKKFPNDPLGHQVLVDEFTADTLRETEYKLGTDIEYGLTKNFMFGSDMLADIVGAPTIMGKYHFFEKGAHKLAFGLRAAYFSKSTLLWGSVKDHFDHLEGKLARPSIAWTHKASPNLNLHTYWAAGIGKVSATLSDKGQRRLWESKHPGEDYETRNQIATDSEDNNEEQELPEKSQENQESSSSSSWAQRTIQVQAITGMLSDRFQITGEYKRHNGNKILISSRIQRTVIDRLRANMFILTASQQWIWYSFQMRLGLGFQYIVITGKDLDGEEIDQAGVLPASDIAFYWRF